MATKRAASETGGRGRARRAVRAALPAYHPKPEKRSGGRSLPTPAHVRVTGVDLSADDREYIRRKLGMKLGKFALSIERVTVRLRDVNGPRGGVDHQCRVKVVLSGLPSVVVEVRNESMQGAIDAAMTAAARSVRKALQRRQTKPLERVRRAPPASAG